MNILIFILSFSSFAQDSRIHVAPLEKNIDTTVLGKKFTHHPYPDENLEFPPNKIERNKLLVKLKIVSKTDKWDELKKDIFYMDYKKLSKPKLVSKYPELKGDL